MLELYPETKTDTNGLSDQYLIGGIHVLCHTRTIGRRNMADLTCSDQDDHKYFLGRQKKHDER